jgi:hypothetical protein
VGEVKLEPAGGGGWGGGVGHTAQGTRHRATARPRHRAHGTWPRRGEGHRRSGSPVAKHFSIRVGHRLTMLDEAALAPVKAFHAALKLRESEPRPVVVRVGHEVWRRGRAPKLLAHSRPKPAQTARTHARTREPAPAPAPDSVHEKACAGALTLGTSRARRSRSALRSSASARPA